MSMEASPTGVKLPGEDSPIEAIRAIQADRKAKAATREQQTQKPAVEIYLDPHGNVQVMSSIDPTLLVQVLVRSYIAIKGELVRQNKTIVDPGPRIVVP